MSSTEDNASNGGAAAAKKQTTGPRARDSMKSTWRRWDRSQWGLPHKLMDMLDIHQSTLDKKVPVHKKTDKVPHVPEWQNQRWILVHALIPLVIHQAWLSLGGSPWTSFATWMIYHAAFQFTKIHEFQALRRLGLIYGHLDGDKHERDEVPDVGVGKTFTSLHITAILRSAAMVALTYDRNVAPLQLNWLWLPLEIGLYGIILDFWFYWYHRAMHDTDSLWKYHRTHHLTKHPNALLTLYADHVQEAFDILGIPLLTYFTMRLMGMPMGYYEWWFCGEYVTFAELAGHSGLRIHSVPPSPLGWLLCYFNVELVIEDHDLHHRHGYKKSHNYGKQTRLWDTVFGTCEDRIESMKDNIDWENTVHIPLWFDRI